MKKSIVLALSLCVSMLCAANDIPEKLMALHPANEKVSCSFTEVRVMPKVKKTETREGTLVYQAPNDLRMDYTSPAGDYILITADKLEQCKKGKTQSVRVKDRDNRYTIYRATLLSCLAGDIDRAAELNDAVSECKKVGNKYVCTITAEVAKSKDMKQIQVEYDVTTGRVLTIKLTEGNGNYATYTTHF
ncbi:MAG: outer membrane lipoprotein carrier protein LolA [Paludibacteraceae bacterium]|nr:outer membrane lipoprotein carrier protein LolA [Paludibacteraceae bacterium]